MEGEQILGGKNRWLFTYMVVCLRVGCEGVGDERE